MRVDLNYFICKRPFVANKKITFRNLSRTPNLSFEGVSYYNLSPKKGNFANSDKTFAGSVTFGTLAAFVMDNVYLDF